MVSRYSILSSTGKVLKHIPTFLYQLLILLWKNALLFRSHYNITLLMIFSPVLICLYLNYQQALTNNYIHSKNLIDSPIVSVDRIPKCYGKDCITLAIGMTHGANAWTDHVIQYLEGNHDLKLGTDIQILSYSNQTLFLESIKKYSNHTQAGVLFCTEYIDLPKNDYTDRIPCKLGNNTDNSFVYSMMYNYTTTKLESFIDLTKNYPIDYSAVALKLAIDRATLEYLSLTQGIHAEINLNIQSYPIIESRYLSGFDVISEGGAMYFLLPSLIVMAVVCMEIVKEKENKLRMGLITLGTSHLAYWVSWILTANFLSVVSNSVLMCTGYYLEYDVFRRVPILVLIYTFYLSSFGLNMLGMVLSACISTTKSAYSVSYKLGTIRYNISISSISADYKLSDLYGSFIYSSRS